MKKLLIGLVFLVKILLAQEPDKIYMNNIKSVKLFQQNNQLGYPIINLNAGETLELHFDDLDGRVKNYYYTYQLCNADWTPVQLSTFDYLKGFSQNRLSQYRMSSIAYAKYVHYQALLPDRNSTPTKSGNYLLKVFLDADTSKLAFTKRLLVLDNLVSIGAQILQPFDNTLFKTHQKVNFTISKNQLNLFNPMQQLKIVLLQNFRWDNAKTNIQPTFIRSNLIEFNTENDCVFAAGNEWRWANLRSFRFLSDRVDASTYNNLKQEIVMKPDPVRMQLRYINYPDYNGFYSVESTDANNSWWQGDYAWVHFTFTPKNNQPYPNKKVYLIGEMNQYQTNNDNEMEYDAVNGVYKKSMYLKTGYYSYGYVTKDVLNKNATSLTELTDGDFWETENDYTILVYYKSIMGRHDELVGLTTINSLKSRRNGF
jgi:hypothetical protein